MKETEQVIFIINPVAGIRPKLRVPQAIQKIFGADEFQIHFTEHRGHAYEIAKQKTREGHKKVVAIGGDGTVNEVASAMVGSGCSLGIVPAGSGNGLARSLRIPVQTIDALKVIKNHKIRMIDAGKVNDHYFFCTCGTGFDASVGKRFDEEEHLRGMAGYIKTAVNEYLHYSPKTYSLKVEGKKVVFEAFLVTFANSGQYGSNAYIAPNAQIDDGMLEMCILRPFPKTSTLEMGLRLFFKNIDQSPYFESMHIKKAELKRKGKKRLMLHLDGEPLKIRGKARVNIIPEALRVMIPVKHTKMESIVDMIRDEDRVTPAST